MFILRGSLTSPFVRKIRVAVDILELANQVRFEPADTLDPTDSLRQQNPLGKVPTLVLEDGTAVYDSRVILEYLDWSAGGARIIPRVSNERFDALRLEALVDGILDAAVLLVQENRFRSPEKREPKWIQHQTERMHRALAVLEKTTPNDQRAINVGDIALACALEWLNLRFDQMCSKTYPNLMNWLGKFANKIPSFADSRPR